MTQVPPPPGPPFSDVEICPFDKVPVSICGGPHIVVRTNLGDEVVRPGQDPVGTPVSEMTEQEQQAHMEAEAAAQRDSDSSPTSPAPSDADGSTATGSDTNDDSSSS